MFDQEIQEIKKMILKQLLSALLNFSNENLIRAIEISQPFIKDPGIKNVSQKTKKLFEQNHPSVQLIKNAFKRLSPNCKNKVLENFFINMAIFGRNKQKELKEKLGFGLPMFFVISPTSQCNLRCVGCYAGQYAKNEGLSFEEVDRILTEAKDLGIYFVTISGGEPFVWPHLLKTLEKHNDMFFQIYTNGTLIDKKIVKKLAKLGNAAPAISIEGFEEETDQRRGNGTFRKIMQAMDNLREAGVLFGFSATPTKKNSEILSTDEFIETMIGKGCAFGWYFQYIPIGRQPDVNLMATPQQRNNLRLRINQIRNSKPIFIGDFWNDGPYIMGCIAGARPRGYFHINSNGDVEPCVFFQFSVDNIKGKKLLEVIQSPFFKAIRDAQPYCQNKNLLTPCAIIDNPWVMRSIVKKYKAKPSYNTDNSIITDQTIANFLDNYSKEYKKITDPIWENDLSKKHKHWKDG